MGDVTIMFDCSIHGVRIQLPFPNDVDWETSSKIGIYQSSQIELALRMSTWEQCERVRVSKFLPDNHVIEFGAGTGFLACFSSKFLNNKKHIVFEPNPLLAPIVEHNRDLNSCNFEVVNKAYSAASSSVDFKVRVPGNAVVALKQPVIFKVEAVSLLDVVEEYGLEDYSLIMDIEGIEYELLNETEALKKCSTLILEIHEPGHEAGGEGFNNNIDLRKFLADQGLRLIDECKCINKVGVYAR
jgi:FkbM family methyltransferase